MYPAWCIRLQAGIFFAIYCSLDRINISNIIICSNDLLHFHFFMIKFHKLEISKSNAEDDFSFVLIRTPTARTVRLNYNIELINWQVNKLIMHVTGPCQKHYFNVSCNKICFCIIAMKLRALYIECALEECGRMSAGVGYKVARNIFNCFKCIAFLTKKLIISHL